MANEKRLITENDVYELFDKNGTAKLHVADIDLLPRVDAVPVVHGRWVLTAHEEYANYRWKVTAECSECHHDKGEVYAGFFSGFPTDLARDIVLEHAESVKLDNYCPNCGAKMDGDGNG